MRKPQSKGVRNPIATEILSDIVESFVLTGKLSSLFDPRGKLTEEQIKEEGKPTVVARMLFENPDGKAALADLYGDAIESKGLAGDAGFLAWGAEFKRRDGKDLDDVFIESGSTLLFVSHALRKVFRDSHVRILVRTNNHLTAWLYLNKRYNHSLVPFLFSGALEEKYHGIFPFFVSGERGNLDEERAAYAQCRLDMAKCNPLLLAASRLSLCHGPLVGSLENAIFKHASYSACVQRLGSRGTPKQVHLLITSDKLVAHQVGQPPGFHTIKEELDKVKSGDCYPVFDLPPSIEENDDLEPTKSPFSEHLCPPDAQPLKDGTRAVQFGDARFRICDSWEELLTKGGLGVFVFIAYRPDEFSWIESEIEFARNHFAGKIALSLHQVGGKDASGYSMCCLVIGDAGGRVDG